MIEYKEETKTEITVRYSETDQMGIAHHSKYPIWFEVARTDFLRKIGFSYSKLESDGILLPLTDIKCRFLKPLKYEDEIIIRTQICRITHVRIGFQYSVFKKETETIVAEGETNQGWTDRQFHPIRIEKHCPELYRALNRYAQNIT